MPDKVIDIPNVGQIAFPESMSEQDINTAAAKLYADANLKHPKPDASHSWVGTAMDWLPTVGGAAGGLIGATGGPATAIGGAALGGAAGEAIKQRVNVARGVQPDPTLKQAAASVGGQAALQGGAEVAGIGIGKGLAAAAPRLMQSAVKPTVAVLKEYGTTAPRIAKTLLEEGINVTENGLAKLQTLFDATNAEIKDAIDTRHSLLQRLAPGRQLERVVDKRQVAARVLPTAAKIAQQTNPARDLRAVGNTVTEFLNHPTMPGKLTLPEAQAMKVGTYQQIGKKYGEMSSAAVETQKALARGLKEVIADEVPEVAALNVRDSQLMAAMDAVGRRAALAGNKDPIGFAWVTKNPVSFLAAMFDRNAAVKSMLARGAYTAAARAGKVSPDLLRAAVGAIAQGASREPDAEPPTP